MAKVGDIVRFLNDVGGGEISKIEGNMAFVLDEDGFETPIPVRECVVIVTEKPKATAYDRPSAPAPSKYVAPEVKKEDEIKIEETPEGDTLNVVLAYEATNLKDLTNAKIQTYLVNDSNYYLYFTYMSRDNGEWNTRYSGIVEPNIQVHLEEITHEDINDISRVAVQYIAFKKDKPFKLKNPVLIETRLDGTKFYKMHCFTENEYFDSPVIAIPIVKDDVPNRPYNIDPEELKMALKEKKAAEQPQKKAVVRHEKPKSHIIECDLHINALLDTTAGLSHTDMLDVQLEEFKKVMDKNIKNKGAKIVFIHGKGEGVLRKALLDELRKRYSKCEAQDASFKEYGFGATLITIH